MLEFQTKLRYIMNRKIIAMIPARAGSERLKLKNLALINDKPLIFYAIQAAKNSGVFDEIVLNSDSNISSSMSSRLDIEYRCLESGL